MGTTSRRCATVGRTRDAVIARHVLAGDAAAVFAGVVRGAGVAIVTNPGGDRLAGAAKIGIALTTDALTAAIAADRR